MNERVVAKLEEANKLIFVKQYAEAERLLDETLSSLEGQNEILVHLRRIELCLMLKKLDRLRERYAKDTKHNSSTSLVKVCLALVEQYGEMVSIADSMSAYQDIMKNYGASAASYYGLAMCLEAQGHHERAIYNYEQCLARDAGWYLAYFGLSQIYYQTNDEKRGDHFFYLFEQAAPFNVYGNFETHRRLYHEFLDKHKYQEAEAAIQTLAEWWQENKGICPPEIQIYELMATARISDALGDKQQAETRRIRAKGMALQALDDPKTGEGVLYFIAKVLEEFDDFAGAFRYYKKILKQDGLNPQMVQKIGSQFLSMGEFRLARELFEEAYQSHPDNPDIRFCLLVSNLKLAGVNVEEYLIGRERLRQLTENGGDRVEVLALLHSLVAKFSGDADVQGHLGDIYLKLGNPERAARHYQTMYDLEGKNKSTALKYAAFVMQYKDAELAMQILNRIPTDRDLGTQEETEIYWLKANYHARQRDYEKSLTLLRRVLAIDPWNVSYLVQEIVNLTNLAKVDEELKKADRVLAMLSTIDEDKIDWSEFDQMTRRFEDEHCYELVYARAKLRYLYANGSEEFLLELVKSACRHDATRGTYDFVKLLNTNFDSPNIYWALGTMFKELWQLETASVWFGQGLLYHGLPKRAKARLYLELADCLIWQNKDLQKATEYAKLSLDLDDKKDPRAVRTLSHALLKSGHIRQAKAYLDQIDMNLDAEARYLKGLLHYRNGAHFDANQLWKPILTMRSESMRFHVIKQEVLRFYFDAEPYLKAN